MEIEDISKEISKQIEINLEKMFAMFGFDKEYLINHAEEFHVVESPHRKRYFHKNKELFYEVITIEEDSYNIEYVPLFN